MNDGRALRVSVVAGLARSFAALTPLAMRARPAFGALLLWFALLRRYWASQLGVFSFLSPIFGVLFGALLLNEPLTANFVVGGGVLLACIVQVSR